MTIGMDFSGQAPSLSGPWLGLLFQNTHGGIPHTRLNIDLVWSVVGQHALTADDSVGQG